MKSKICGIYCIENLLNHKKSHLKAFLDTIIYKLKDWYYGK